VPIPGKLTAPVVGARAGFHADQAGRQIGNQLQQLSAWYLGAHQRGLACLIHALHGKDILGEINSNGYDSHDFPSQVS